MKDSPTCDYYTFNGLRKTVGGVGDCCDSLRRFESSDLFIISGVSWEVRSLKSLTSLIAGLGSGARLQLILEIFICARNPSRRDYCIDSDYMVLPLTLISL